MLLVLPLLAFSVELACGAGVNWCGKDFECVVNGVRIPHSMCNPNANKVCEHPQNPKDLMTSEVENEILKLHNDLRASMSSNPPYGLPIACPLRALVWDSVLAEVATNWAMNCVMKLDPCRKVKDSGKDWQVEQNMQIMIWSWGQTAPRNSLKTSVGLWWKMMRTADAGIRGRKALIEKYKKGSWDSAVQMIWADTRKIGCGYVAWQFENKGGFQKTLVCNYGPLGISAGLEVYRTCLDPIEKPITVPGVTEPSGDVDGDVIVLDSAGNSHYPLKLDIEPKSLGTKSRFSYLVHFPIILLMISQGV